MSPELFQEEEAHGDRDSKLSIEDRLLMTLKYPKEYRERIGGFPLSPVATGRVAGGVLKERSGTFGYKSYQKVHLRKILNSQLFERNSNKSH